MQYCSWANAQDQLHKTPNKAFQTTVKIRRLFVSAWILLL